ncbi:hypothetical protein CAL29_16385, partial [Bordetella genomosp. 10]
FGDAGGCVSNSGRSGGFQGGFGNARACRRQARCPRDARRARRDTRRGGPGRHAGAQAGGSRHRQR